MTPLSAHWLPALPKNRQVLLVLRKRPAVPRRLNAAESRWSSARWSDGAQRQQRIDTAIGTGWQFLEGVAQP